MIHPNSEFFIEKPIAKKNDRVAMGPIFLASRFGKIVRGFGKNSASRSFEKKQKTDGFELQSVWSGIVGDDVGQMSFPVRITPDGTLNISIINTAIATTLLYSQSDILQKVNAFFGQEIVKKIKITEVKN
ncbi:MAG: DUF721 domain-containing protein [Rickettsiales bacterium]|jgi:hypothetical protein|nr:DUF721 domain-containing protein [Rickettsiales bacterium]